MTIHVALYIHTCMHTSNNNVCGEGLPALWIFFLSQTPQTLVAATLCIFAIKNVTPKRNVWLICNSSSNARVHFVLFLDSQAKRFARIAKYHVRFALKTSETKRTGSVSLKSGAFGFEKILS